MFIFYFRFPLFHFLLFTLISSISLFVIFDVAHFLSLFSVAYIFACFIAPADLFTLFFFTMRHYLSLIIL